MRGKKNWTPPNQSKSNIKKRRLLPSSRLGAGGLRRGWFQPFLYTSSIVRLSVVYP